MWRLLAVIVFLARHNTYYPSAPNVTRMKTNYVSDAVDVPPDALMDEPFCEIRLDLSQLPVQQQMQLVREIGPEHLEDDEMRAAAGAVISGADDEPWAGLAIRLHIDAGRALTFLNQVGLLDMQSDVDGNNVEPTPDTPDPVEVVDDDDE